MALAGRLRADQHGDAAVAIEPHVCRFWPVIAASLDIGGDADAAQAAGALGGGGAFVKAVPVGNFLRARHVACEIARVVDFSGRRRVRHRLRLDRILAAQRVGRGVEIARRRIDQPLDQIGGLRPPGAAIGVDRNGVGIGRAQPHMGDRNVIGAGRHAGAEPGNVRRVAGQIGAHVGDDIEREREEAPLVVERQPRAGDVVAAVAVAEKMLGALANPFHRPAQPLGGNRRQRIFAIGKQLGAEAAADVGRDDAHAVGRQLEHIAADDVADDVAALTAERERVAVAVVFGDDPAGIHVIRNQPLIDDGERDGLRRLRERRLGEPRRPARSRTRDCPAGPARLRRARRQRRM